MARRESLRASDSDRELIVDRLHQAATEGRIVAEELEQRVSAALTARTYQELDATVSDLPGPRTAHRREPARRSGGQWVVSTVAHNPMLLLFAIPLVAVTAAMVLAATIVWSVLMIVVMVLGGRPRVGAPPWIYARRQAVRQVRRRAGGNWA
ncbi:MAG: DUF1707 SHOCT-like domain-containing protein [Solirubrobacteraceae bacterium]